MINDRQNQIDNALSTKLRVIARELDQCSPEVRNLIRVACSGAGSFYPNVSMRDREGAQLRLGEALSTLTKEAKAARRVTALAPCQPAA